MDGYAVGGLAVGENYSRKMSVQPDEWYSASAHRQTYLSDGCGTPANILEGVEWHRL